jgi:hypothetical protein
MEDTPKTWGTINQINLQKHGEHPQKHGVQVYKEISKNMENIPKNMGYK